MNYRKDKYGNDLSVLGFGCMRFPKNEDGTIDKHVDFATLESLYGKVVGKLCDLTEIYKNDLVIICGSNALEDVKYPVFPLHEIVPLNYKETVKEDIKNAFLSVLKVL